jgi:hypothetical protein
MKTPERTPRIPLTRRAAALLATVLFVFAWSGDAFGYHPCAHHSALGPHAAASAPPHAAPGDGHAGSHEAHAVAPDGHSAHPAAPATSSSEAAEHDGACLCVGGCPVAGASLPAGTEIAVSAPEEGAPSTVPPAPAARLPRHRPHVLPFAQGPPSLS